MALQMRQQSVVLLDFVFVSLSKVIIIFVADYYIDHFPALYYQIEFDIPARGHLV